LTWRPRADTEFNLSLEYKNNNDAIDYGIPALGDRPAPVPHERYFGVVGAESDRSFYLVDANWSHSFADDWQIRHRFLWYFNETDYQDAGPLLFNPFNPRLLDLFVSSPYREEYDEYFTELQVNGRMHGLGMQHDLLFSFEYNRATHDNALIGVNSLTDPFTLRAIDIFNPVYQGIEDLPSRTVPGNYNLRSFFSLREREYWYAATAQDIVRLNRRLTFAFTGRYDIVASVSSGNCLQTVPCTVEMQEVEDDVFSPRVGANLEVLPWLAMYGSYAKSFGSPSGASVLADGSPAGFEKGEQIEAGLKGHWLDDRLTASLAFYHLTKSDLAVATILPGVGVVADVVGEARSRGIELDVRGALTDRWSLLASYAFTDARVTEDQDVTGTPPVLTDGRKGLRLANVPEQSASLWLRYTLTDAFSVAGGVFAMTEREVDADNLVDIPGYARVDLAAQYRHRIGRSWLTAQLNVNNLLDKEYFDPQTSFAQTINASPAAPRTLIGSVRLEF
jgi:iron complex outermembrane receptor protein